MKTPTSLNALKIAFSAGGVFFRLSIFPGFLDDPVVRVASGGNWSATWFCENRVERRQGSGSELVIDCAGKRSAYPLVKAAIPAAVCPAPGKLAVLSDIEGNRAFLDA